MRVLLIADGKVVAPERLELCFGEEQPGIFETLRTYHGRFFRAEEHCERFIESARTLGMETLITEARLRRELDGVLQVLRRRKKNKKTRTAMKNEGDHFIRSDFVPNRLFVRRGSKWHRLYDNIEGITWSERTYNASTFIENKNTTIVADNEFSERQNLSQMLKPSVDFGDSE